MKLPGFLSQLIATRDSFKWKVTSAGYLRTRQDGEKCGLSPVIAVATHTGKLLEYDATASLLAGRRLGMADDFTKRIERAADDPKSKTTRAVLVTAALQDQMPKGAAE